MLELPAELKQCASRAIEEEKGQGLVEYALILLLIAIVAISALSFFGGHVTTLLSTVASSLDV